MSLNILKRYWSVLGCSLLGCSLLFASVTAGAATVEEAVKAGFIYNFTKFIVWPGNANVASQAHFTICVTGEDALLGSLETLYGKLAEQKPIVIRRDLALTELHTCDLVYVAEADAAAERDVLKTIDRLPILTISDSPQFVAHGGMIGFIRDGNHVGFEVNQEAAKLSNINISSQLLKLAKNVKGRH